MSQTWSIGSNGSGHSVRLSPCPCCGCHHIIPVQIHEERMGWKCWECDLTASAIVKYPPQDNFERLNDYEEALKVFTLTEAAKKWNRREGK